MLVSSFSTTFVLNSFHSKKNSARYYHKFILVLNFLDRFFSKNTQISNFMKIRQVGAKLFHEDGRTHMTKLTVAFRNFANAP